MVLFYYDIEKSVSEIDTKICICLFVCLFITKINHEMCSIRSVIEIDEKHVFVCLSVTKIVHENVSC